MFRRSLITLVLIVSFAAPAAASPVFLRCSLSNENNGAAFEVEVQMNEEAGTVSYAFPEVGRAYTVAAVFTTAEVSFNNFTVSRTSLAFKRSNDGDLSKIAGYPPYSYGTCSLDTSPRAF